MVCFVEAQLWKHNHIKHKAGFPVRHIFIIPVRYKDVSHQRLIQDTAEKGKTSNRVLQQFNGETFETLQILVSCSKAVVSRQICRNWWDLNGYREILKGRNIGLQVNNRQQHLTHKTNKLTSLDTVQQCVLNRDEEIAKATPGRSSCFPLTMETWLQLYRLSIRLRFRCV